MPNRIKCRANGARVSVSVCLLDSVYLNGFAVQTMGGNHDVIAVVLPGRHGRRDRTEPMSVGYG